MYSPSGQLLNPGITTNTGQVFNYSEKAFYLPPDHQPFAIGVTPGTPYVGMTLPPATYSDGDEIDLVARERTLITGTTKNLAGENIQAQIRVFDGNGQYIAGTRSNRNTGIFNVKVPMQAGRVSVEAHKIQQPGECCVLHYDPLVKIDVDSSNPDPLDFIFDEQLSLLSIDTANFVSFPVSRVSLFQNGKVVAVDRYSSGNMAEIEVSPGIYDISIETVGYEKWQFNDVDLSEDILLRLPRKPLNTWKGKLLDDEGNPIVLNTHGIMVRNGIGSGLIASQFTDQDGNFEIPISKGVDVIFPHSVSGNGLQQMVHIEKDEDIRRDIQLKPLMFEPFSHDLSAIIPPAHDNVYKVIILAEGYREQAESYQDTNANGVWDGVFFLDLNGNGVWDSSPYEPFTVYGSAGSPIGGEDPRAQNEPFEDMNDDGTLAFGGRALFERNAQNFVRDWFSSEFWRDNQDKFAVYVYYQDSVQEGFRCGGQ